MASIIRLSKEKRPPRAIEFTAADGSRPRIRLGRVTRETAEYFKTRVEYLQAAQACGMPLDRETASWLGTLTDTMHHKLARRGLCEPRTSAATAPRLAEFVDRYITQRATELKPRSVELLRQTAAKLIGHFGTGCALSDVTPAEAAGWQAGLRAELSEATVRLHTRNAKTMFKAGIEWELLSRSPFTGLKSASLAAERDYYLPPGDAARLIQAAPCAQWRLLLGLARYAGLRVPSESHGLRWGDVDWERGRLRVYAPKAHRQGRSEADATRIVPIEPRLLSLLEDAFGAAPAGQEHVITLSRSNLRRTLVGDNARGYRGIVDKAGLPVWSDAFQTLRRSCESEWSTRYPQHAVSTWLGHGMRVSEQHYLSVPDELYDRASRGGEAQRNAQQSACAPSGQEVPSTNRAEAGSAPRSANSPGQTGLCAASRNGPARIRTGDRAIMSRQL